MSFKELDRKEFIKRFSFYEVHIVDNKTDKIYTLGTTDADFSGISEDVIDLHYDFKGDLEEVKLG